MLPTVKCRQYIIIYIYNSKLLGIDANGNKHLDKYLIIKYPALCIVINCDISIVENYLDLSFSPLPNPWPYPNLYLIPYPSSYPNPYPYVSCFNPLSCFNPVTQEGCFRMCGHRSALPEMAKITYTLTRAL